MAVTGKPTRLSKAAREFNVGLATIVEFLAKKGIEVSNSPNTKLDPEMYELLTLEFQSEKTVKEEAEKIGLDYADHQTISLDDKIVAKAKMEDEDEFDDVFIKENLIKRKQEEKPVEEVVVEVLPEKEVEKETPVEEIPQKEEKEKKEEKPKAAEVKKKVSKPKEDKEEVEPVEEEKTEVKEEKVEKVGVEDVEEKEEKAVEEVKEEVKEEADGSPKVLGKIDLDKINLKTKPDKKSAEEKKKEREDRIKSKKVEKPEVSKKTKKTPVEEQEEVVKAVEVPVEKELAGKEVPKEKEEVKNDNFIKTKFTKLEGPKIVDKIVLPPEKKKTVKKKPVASSKDPDLQSRRKKRKRIRKPEQVSPGKADQKKHEKSKPGFKDKRVKRDHVRPEIKEEDIQKQIKDTLAKLTGTGKSKAAKYRKEKRQNVSQQKQKELEKIEEEKSVLKVTEFVTANELATMMNLQVNEIIATCMSLGLFVSINQRLDAETLTLLAEEFEYSVEFVSADVQETILEIEEDDNPEDLLPRTPIVTVMGHVDHGKTKLLDYIRKANVVAGEAGGITQHIGAYEVKLENDKRITFLDTPGHEAFTAMRARGAKVTDVAIIVVAADDNVMPQTKEAINHAQAAGVPIVIAINKVDKPNANPDKIKDELSKMNILTEDWGGKFQSQEISAKEGINIDELLEKVLLEAEMLDLKANPKKRAIGTVIESSLDKGRGYVAKLLVQDGTLKTGDIVIAGSTVGRVKAMYNERNQKISEAGPATPLLLLGLNGAPQAGDVFNVLKDEKEAKAIANKRLQLQREQGIRTQKHITLDEIGRRIAIGDFKELNVIVKGDVDGSIEALSDSLLKLSNEQIQVNIILKAVGAVTETDVMLASASDAIIVAFQVRPSVSARKLAEQEQIDIRLYSIIYQAIEEIKSAMEGMLSPDIEEKIVCNVEIREVFKITKVGSVAGCMVLDGVITRNTRVRIIREGIVVYTGNLGSLKRFKDDVKEVKTGYECGLNIDNYNDIKVGDIIEGYEEVEVKKKL